MSHWGAFAADVDASGEVTAVRPDALDPAPSPLLGNFVGALRHPLRVATPMVRRGWLERGPGPDAAPRHRRVRRGGLGRGARPARRRARPGVRRARHRRRCSAAPTAGRAPGASTTRRASCTASSNCLGGYVRSREHLQRRHVRGAAAAHLRRRRARPAALAHRVAADRRAHRAARRVRRHPGQEPLGRPRRRHPAPLRRRTSPDWRDRGGEVVLAGPDRADLPAGLAARWLPRAARHRRRADARAVPRARRRGPARRRASSDRTARAATRRSPTSTARTDGVEKPPRGRRAICGVPADDDPSRWPARWRPGTRWSP